GPDRLPRGRISLALEPHAGQHPVGRATRRFADAFGPQPRRADRAAPGGVALRAEQVRPALRQRHLRGGADALARQPRPRRQGTAALRLPPASDAPHPAGGVIGWFYVLAP